MNLTWTYSQELLAYIFGVKYGRDKFIYLIGMKNESTVIVTFLCYATNDEVGGIAPWSWMNLVSK